MNSVVQLQCRFLAHPIPFAVPRMIKLLSHYRRRVAEKGVRGIISTRYWRHKASIINKYRTLGLRTRHVYRKSRLNYPDRDEAEWFLTALDPSGDRFTFRTFDDNWDRWDGDLNRILHGTLAQRWDELLALNERGAAICVTVNVTDLKGGAISNIIGIRAVFTDLDGAPLEPVLNCPTQPHIITETSPQRWHAYWRVANGELNEFSNLQKALIAHFDGDKNIHDLQRILRVPGFIHRKGTPFFSRIHTINYTLPPYEWEALKKGFPLPEPEKPQRPPPRNDDYDDMPAAWRRLNDDALANLSAWVPLLFPGAGTPDRIDRVLRPNL